MLSSSTAGEANLTSRAVYRLGGIFVISVLGVAVAINDRIRPDHRVVAHSARSTISWVAPK
ncbi:MAG: hypothetical protein ACKPAJ_00250, partial [Actinomycetota bacterium]